MITAVPADMPVNKPVIEVMLATAVLLLAHVPPIVASASKPEAPTQATAVPVIAGGSGFTVTDLVAIHPAGEL